MANTSRAVQTITIPGGRISSSGLTEWKEQENKLMWAHELSKAVYLAWDSTKTEHQNSWFSVRLATPLPTIVSTKILSFTLAESKENATGKAIDFKIELMDKRGHKISFPLSECSYFQPQITKDISKFKIPNDSPNSEAIPDFFILM